MIWIQKKASMGCSAELHNGRQKNQIMKKGKSKLVCFARICRDSRCIGPWIFSFSIKKSLFSPFFMCSVGFGLHWKGKNIRVCVFLCGFRALFINSVSIDFNKFFFKIGFHSTIHTFKNYFVTVFLIFNNKLYPPS